MKNKIPYTPPKFDSSAFNCSFCNAYSNQSWHALRTINGNYIEKTRICFCNHCGEYSIWHNEKIIFPEDTFIEIPNSDLNKEIIEDYQEASSILQKSPRGAAALLRLAIQKLCIQLHEKGDDLNKDIGNLVKKGLPVRVQQSLDTLRVIGNEAVHPGQLDLKDDISTSESLFKLVNFIAEKMITEPKEIEELYNKIPESKKEQIKKRDVKK